MLLRCTIVLCLVSSAVFGQQVDQSEVKDQDQLVAALISACRADLSCSRDLLDSHKDLVTPELWQRIILMADDRAIDEAYRTKYGRSGGGYVDAMVSPNARAATLRLVPR